jgi:hypothetical protein
LGKNNAGSESGEESFAGEIIWSDIKGFHGHPKKALVSFYSRRLQRCQALSLYVLVLLTGGTAGAMLFKAS